MFSLSARERNCWHRLAGPEDGVLDVEGFRDDLYLLSNAGAPRHRVLRVKASAASLAGARVARRVRRERGA